MKIILTEDQYGQLTEMIKLDIKVGDTIMGGKFKNKKVVVKTIGKNDKGDITINGKPLLRFRIIKESASNDIEKRYKTYSKLLNELTEEFDWVSKIDVKLSSTAESGGWKNEQSKPLVKISVYFKNYQKIQMTTQFELFDEIRFIHDMFFPHLTGDPLIYSDNITAYLSTKSVFPNGKTDSFPSQNQIVSGDYDDVSQINESNNKNKIGSENFNRLLTKVVNSIINEYLKKTTTINHDFDFRVKVRKGTDTPFVGCNAGSHGEPYNYVIEVYSDIEIPKYFTYNDEYKKNHNKISDGFHNSILSREIKDILPMIGLDIESLGNVFGVCFNGKTDDFSSNKPVSEGDYDDVSQINESNEKNKNFLKNKFGIDLDGKIKMIQSYEDLPLVFAPHFYPKDFNRMLNDGGPFYVMNITKGYKIGNKYVNKLYLYRPRVDGSSFLVDQDGYNKSESTFLENLGIDVIGLTIKDLIDMYFEESINESEEKQPKYLNIIKELIEQFKKEDCVCDIRVTFKYDMYIIYLVFGTEELNDKFSSFLQRAEYTRNLRNNVKNTIKDYLPIDNLYIGSISKSNCEWKPMNESTFFRRRVDMSLMDKEFFDILNIITDVYLSKYNNGIDFNFETFKGHVIRYFMDGYHNDLTNGGENDYPVDEVYAYLSNYFHKKIKDIYDTNFGRNINKSENKKQSLMELIDQYGLYAFLQTSGLDITQISSVLKNMDNPKEILKQYIRDFVLIHGYKWGDNSGILSGYEIEVSENKYVDEIEVIDVDLMSVKVFDLEYGSKEKKTSINALSNNELLTIIDWMVKSIKNGEWD